MAFSLLTWCLWSCPEPEQSWAFPKRLGLFQGGLITIYFQKLIESPKTVTQREERDIPAPGTTWRGRAALQVPFSTPWLPRGRIGPPGQPRVRKSCLAGSSLVPWPCHGLGAPRRLLTLSGHSPPTFSCLAESSPWDAGNTRDLLEGKMAM